MTASADLLHNILKKQKYTDRDKLKDLFPNYRHNYIVQSCLTNKKYDRRYYTHFKSAERFAFLERLKGRQVDIYDIKEHKFI